MKKTQLCSMKATWLVGIFALVLCSFTAAVFNWQVQEDDYVIKFHSRSASGTIKGLKGSIQFDSADLGHSRFDVTVDVNTLNTGNKLKNKHAWGKHFFDVASYPTIGFVTDSIIQNNPLRWAETARPLHVYYAYGRLRIKDVTRNIIIPFSFERQGNKGIFRGHFSIDRKDYNLHRFAVSRHIDIEMAIPVRL